MGQIVINKTARPLVVAKLLSEGPDGRKNFEPLTLRPGSNEVDDKTAEFLSKSAAVGAWTSKGMIELVKAAKVGEGLEGYDAAQSVMLIADCYDLVTLKKWADGEKRKDVTAALNKRKKELEKLMERE